MDKDSGELSCESVFVCGKSISGFSLSCVLSSSYYVADGWRKSSSTAAGSYYYYPTAAAVDRQTARLTAPCRGMGGLAWLGSHERERQRFYRFSSADIVWLKLQTFWLSCCWYNAVPTPSHHHLWPSSRSSAVSIVGPARRE